MNKIRTINIRLKYILTFLLDLEVPTALATGNIKMKRVRFRTKRVCFSSANVGVVF